MVKILFQKINFKEAKKKVLVKIFKCKKINDKLIKKYLMNIEEKVIVYCGYPGQIIIDKELLKNKFFYTLIQVKFQSLKEVLQFFILFF